MDDLKVRMKVWTHPGTKKKFLVSVGFKDAKLNMIGAYLIDDEVPTPQLRNFSVEDWNQMPFHYFQEIGKAETKKAPEQYEVPANE